MQNFEIVNVIAKKTIVESQQKSKGYHDKKTKEPSLQRGDCVLLKNQNIQPHFLRKLPILDCRMWAKLHIQTKQYINWLRW